MKSLTSDAYAWAGTSGASWDSAANWNDATTGANPAPSVPGTLTPVTIAGPTGSPFELIDGGGSAFSVGLTGNISLADRYTVGGLLKIGALEATPAQSGGVAATLTPGSLALAARGAITAGSVELLDGTLSLAGAASLSTTGAVAVGTAGDANLPWAGRYIPTGTAPGVISLTMGAMLLTAGNLSINSGVLSDIGGTVGVHGALTIGTADTSSSSAPSNFGADGQLIVTSGGLLTVDGAVTVCNGIIAVGGAGSRLTVSGTLMATAGGSFNLTGPNGFQRYFSGSVAAGDGGYVQLGGVVFSAPASAINIPPGLAVAGNGSIEIGSAGNAAAGAITVDAGKAIIVNTIADVSADLVVNGIVTIVNAKLTQNGSLSGSGAVQIGSGATLALNGTAAATIAFLDTGAALSIAPSYSSEGPLPVVPPFSVDAVITGFRTGDSIILATHVSAANYAAGLAGSPGMLVLSNGAAMVETLLLAGDFTGRSFVVSPTPGSGATISLIDQPTLPASDPLFDRAYYLSRNPDVAAAGVDPYQHFLTFGWKEGRDPSPLFSTSYYFAHNPDVAAARVDPLLHFEGYGWHEGRNPDALFDTRYYLAHNPDVAKAGVDPLQHYEEYGWHEGRDPSVQFSTHKYLAAYSDVKAAGLDPLQHYLEYGQNEGRTAFRA